jgi:hypothetical protein
MRTRTRCFWATSVLVLLIFSLVPGQAQTRQHLKTLDISLFLKEPKSKTATAVSMRAVGFGTRKTAVKDGDTIQSLLESGGIQFDGSSLSLVYDLNPQLESARTLEIGSEIELPHVSPATLKRNRAAGHVVAIGLDRRLKRQLLMDHARLKQLVKGLFGATSGQSPNDEITATLRETLEALGLIAKTIREDIQPFSRDSLSQLADETSLLMAILEKVASQRGKFTDEDRRTIARIQADLNVKIESFSDSKGPNDPPDRHKAVRVIVKTVRNGQPVSSIRIFYIGEALFNNSRYQPKSFASIDNPGEKNINQGDYMIWAAKAEDGSRISQPVLVNVRQNQVVNGFRGLGLYVDIAIK